MTDERDTVDPALDAMMRAHSSETPPRELDATILAAAHRAAQSAPRRAPRATSPWRWWMPLTAAAVIGAIAIGVMQLAPTERETAQVLSDTPTRVEPKPKQEMEERKRADAATTQQFATAPPEPFPAMRENEAAGAPPAAAMRAAPAAVTEAQWIERIRSLLSAGKTEDAAQALGQFRVAYSDADDRLPADLKAWAATIKR